MGIRNRSGTGGIRPETRTEIYQILVGKRIHLSKKPGPEWILPEPDPNIRNPCLGETSTYLFLEKNPDTFAVLKISPNYSWGGGSVIIYY